MWQLKSQRRYECLYQRTPYRSTCRYPQRSHRSRRRLSCGRFVSLLQCHLCTGQSHERETSVEGGTSASRCLQQGQVGVRRPGWPTLLYRSQPSELPLNSLQACAIIHNYETEQWQLGSQLRGVKKLIGSTRVQCPPAKEEEKCLTWQSSKFMITQKNKISPSTLISTGRLRRVFIVPTIESLIPRQEYFPLSFISAFHSLKISPDCGSSSDPLNHWKFQEDMRLSGTLHLSCRFFPEKILEYSETISIVALYEVTVGTRETNTWGN